MLVVGGGEVATRKVRELLAVRASVHVVAPTASPTIEALAAEVEVVFVRRSFVPTYVVGAWLVVSATDAPEINRAVAEAARRAYMFSLRPSSKAVVFWARVVSCCPRPFTLRRARWAKCPRKFRTGCSRC